jgi:transposase
MPDPVTGRWTVAHDRWHTAVVDATGTGGLLAHIDGRTAAKVTEWLLAQPDPWRDRITHVTIDLSASYLRAVTDALPDAVVVADRFHLVQLANQMLTDVRQRATRDVRGRRGRKKDPEWAARRRLLTGYERLSPETFARLWNSLIDAGDPGLEILHAYTVKENLRHLLDLAGTSPDREVISHRLWRFYDQAASSSSPEVHRLAATIEAWWPAVEAAITTGYSNARSEGYNRLAKHQGRNAFGFRNVENHRRRIRWACTRQHRRATALINEMPGSS